MGGDDAIDEEDLILCCALCCANLSYYPSADCCGCSGKIGLCCLNAEVCCKVRSYIIFSYDCSYDMCVHMICPLDEREIGYGIWRILYAKCTLRLMWCTHSFYCPLIQLHIQPGAPCLPCCCCGPAIECDGCSICNAQAHLCCCVASAALPCNDEVPVALSVAGLTVYPKCGCCVPMKEIMNR